MNPIGAGERLGHYFDYGSIPHKDGLARPEQAADARARSVLQAAGELANRCLVQIVDGIKSRVADHKVEAPGKLESKLDQASVKKTAERQSDRFTKSLKATEQLLVKAKVPVEKVVSRFLDSLDEMDMEDYETLLERLTATAPDIDPVKQNFRAQVVATLRAGIASDMDAYALRALDDMAKVCAMESTTIADVANQAFAFVWLRSKLLERHPEAVSESSLKSDQKIQRWFSRQTPEVKEDVTYTVELIANTPERNNAYLSETLLRTFCQRVQTALHSTNAH